MSCPQNTPPCQDCEQALQSIDTFCEDGCPQTLHSNCMVYDGTDIELPDGSSIENLSILTDVIKKLAQNNLDVILDITFSPITRKLCLLKNGQVAKCVIIPDADDQYLKLNDKKIEIWKPSIDGVDIKINEVDISAILGISNITSSSLSVTNLKNIEFVPSTQLGNHLTIGSDGKPYTPVQNLSFNNSTKNLSISGGNNITLDGFVALSPLLQQVGNINIQGVVRGDGGVKTGNTDTSIAKIWKLGSAVNNGHTLSNPIIKSILDNSASLSDVIGVVNNLTLQIANINQRFNEFKEYTTVNIDGVDKYILFYNKTN